MLTIDEILLKIVNSSSPKIEELLSKNDCKILRSLSTSITSNLFITENQSKLLVKILRENLKKIPDFSEEIDEAIKNNFWSHHFRQIEQKRKFYIGKNEEQELVLLLEFTFNSQIRKILQNLSKNIEGMRQKNSGKMYEAAYTEKNIVVLIEALINFNFDTDQKITDHYNTIKSWSKSDFADQFSIDKLKNKFIGIDAFEDLDNRLETDIDFLLDRRLRYQYNIEEPDISSNSIKNRISSRKNVRIWIDKNSYSLEDVLKSLVELKRIPTMIVFDNTSEDKTLKNMEFLEKSLEKLNLEKNVGVYFRLPNNDIGGKFNKIIASKQYNKRLDDNTEIVVVQSGKIPKFLLSTTWRPMSVIVLDSVMGMRHGKTAIYTNCCDLIVEYADEPAIKDSIIYG